MAEECITLESGCEVEIVEIEACDIDIVVSTDSNSDHALLSNRGIDDQHPILAITGLRAELDSKVESVVAGANITVDNTDPQNPVVASTGGGGGGQVDSVVGGTNVSMDNTDPINPIVNVPNIGGQVDGVIAGANITVDNTDPENPIVSSTGGGGGLPTITVDTTIYVTVAGNDITGDGSVGNPYATPNKALSSLDGVLILGQAMVTISIGAGDYAITEPLICNNNNPDNVLIQGASLLKAMVEGVHYVPRDGAYPAVGTTIKLKVTSRSSGLSDIASHVSLFQATFATRLNYSSSTFNMLFDSAVIVKGVSFPKISNIAFIDNETSNQISKCISLDDNSNIELSNVGILGFGISMKVDDESIITGGAVVSASPGFFGLDMDRGNYNSGFDVLTIGGSGFVGIDADAGSQFNGAAIIGGSFSSGLTASNSILSFVFSLEIVGSSGINTNQCTINAGGGNTTLHDLSSPLTCENSIVNFSGGTFESIDNFLNCTNGILNLVDVLFDNNGLNTHIRAFSSAKVYISGAEAFITYTPPVNELNGNGAQIIDVQDNTLVLTDAPEAPTAIVGTNTNQIASTAFVIANAGSSGQVNSIVGGTNVTIDATDPVNPTVNVPSIGVEDVVNVGTGVGKVSKGLSGSDAQVKSIKAGTGVVITNGVDDITIDATGAGGGEANTSSNVGVGEGLAKAKNGVDLPFKSLTAGNAIALTGNVDDVGIAVTEADISHLNITNIGTNSHLQIDTHIANILNPHQVSLEKARTQSNVLSGPVDMGNNDIENVKEIKFNTGGLIKWNSTDKTIDVDTTTGTVIQVGQELAGIFYNNTGLLIPNGSVVYVVPGGMTNSRPHIDLAIANTHESLLTTLFTVTQDIPNSSEGFATKFGKIRDFDTSAWPVGSILWVSTTTPGSYTNTPPEFPNYRAGVAIVTVSSATVGELFADINVDLDDTFRNFYNGIMREQFELNVASNGTIITATLTATSGDHLTMIFSDGFTSLDVSTPPTVTLTAGSATVPQENFIYIPLSTKVLTNSSSGFPTTEHIKIAEVIVLSATETQTDGVLGNRNVNDALQDTTGVNQGHLTHITERLRKSDAVWESGTEATLAINDTPTPDEVTVAVTGGKVYQLHIHDFSAMNTNTGDHVHAPNHNTTPYLEVSNLNVLTSDANGDSLTGRFFSFVLWGVVNEEVNDSKLMINLPLGSYGNNTGNKAVEDSDNFSVYNIPKMFSGKGFLIARFTLELSSNGNNWTLIDTQDLRGFKPNNTAGAGGGGGIGVTTYLGLTDTPNQFTGDALKIQRVNIGETDLESVLLDKALIGLSNVDNTSDADKPISTATQVALDSKLDDVIAGTNITIDKTDPKNPIIASTGGGGGGQVDSIVAGSHIAIDNTDPINPIASVISVPNNSVDTVQLVDDSVDDAKLDFFSIRDVGWIPAAWANFTGINGTITDSHGVDFVTRNSTGDYTVTLLNQVAINGCVVGMTSNIGAPFITGDNNTIGEVQLRTRSAANNPEDAIAVTFVLFGG